MRKILCFSVLSVLYFLSLGLSAQPFDDELKWNLRRDRSGIKIFTAKVEGSKFRAVSASMMVDGKVESLVELVSDLENCPNWAAMCKRASLEKRISPAESYVHTVNDLPFPVRDRDVLAHVRWQRDSATGTVTMSSQAVSGDGLEVSLPKVKGVVRVTKANTGWFFTPQGDGTVLVQSFAHVDPNGPIPAWIVNRLLIGSPFKTMKRMREIIEQGGYADAQLAF